MITQLDKKKLLYYTLVHQFIHFLQLWWPWYLKCSLLLDLRQNWQVGLKHAILCHCLQKQRATITQHKNPIYSCQRESFDDCLWSKRSMNNKALNHLSYKLSSDKNCQFPLNVWVSKSQKQQCSAALSRNVEAFSVIEDRGLYWLSDIRHTFRPMDLYDWCTCWTNTDSSSFIHVHYGQHDAQSILLATWGLQTCVCVLHIPKTPNPPAWNTPRFL